MDEKQQLINDIQQLYKRLKEHSIGLLYNGRVLPISKSGYLSDFDRLCELATKLHGLDADAIDLQMLETTMNKEVANLANNHSESKQTIGDLMDKATAQIRIDLYNILKNVK